MGKVLLLKFSFLFSAILLTQSISNSQPIIWQRIYDGPAHGTDVAFDICESTDGYFYAVGTTTVLGLGYRPYIVKLNQYGDTL